MKKNTRICITLGLLIFCVLAVTITACQKEKGTREISHYTCPMHPQIKMDAPGSCPICGMTLVPVKKEIPSSKESSENHETHNKETKTPEGIRIDPVHTQNIGVKIDKVSVRPLSRSILVYGKVAHDANLWVAQSEYIEALNLGDSSLIKSSELKLQFLGLSPEWIKIIKNKRKADLALHLPTKNESGYFEAFVHQRDVDLIKVDQTVDILDDKARLIQTGVIEAIGTIVDSETRLVRVLVRSNEPTDFKSNTFVQFRINIPLGDKLSVPSEAILFNGDHNMVYLVTESNRYLPKKVILGEEAGEYFEVKDGLNEGDQVVTNGHFLIDSETQIKMGSNSAGHQH